MLHESDNRPHGTLVYRMPAEVNGHSSYPYALAIRKSEVGLFDEQGNSRPYTEVRMVNTEGVSYLVTPEKDWCWTDYIPSEKHWTITELLEECNGDSLVDLADWVRTFGSRLESNFYLIWEWINEA